jgi:hypothetical protein
MCTLAAGTRRPEARVRRSAAPRRVRCCSVARRSLQYEPPGRREVRFFPASLVRAALDLSIGVLYSCGFGNVLFIG